MELICEHDYVERLIRRIPYSEPQTRIQMEEVEKMLRQYCEERLR